MATITSDETMIESLSNAYQNMMNKTDPRVRDYPLIWNDPRPVLSLVALYILFIIVGKRVMRDRPAINVPSYILFIYNFSLVLLSIYMFVEIAIGIISQRLEDSKYDFLCATVTNTPSEMRLANALWWYFFSKVIEFMDTFWMVIRKSFRQITFLHVFHHSSMLLIWWAVVSWVPTGQAYFGAALNCLVHVVMYLYYALAVVPSLKNFLWWKKYITVFQLGQFITTLAHTLIGIYKTLTGQCKFPLFFQYLLTAYMIMMFGLFINFYMQEYIKKNNDKKKIKQEDQESLKKDLNNNLINLDEANNRKEIKNGHLQSNKSSKKSN